MAFDSLELLSAAALLAASIGAWLLSAPLKAAARVYLRFAATLFAALALAWPLGLAPASLLLSPLAASALAVAGFARFLKPLPLVLVSLVLIAGLASGLAALVSGRVMLALVPQVLCGLAVAAVAMNGLAIIPVVAGLALAASGLLLAQDAGSALLLFSAAALVGLTKPLASAPGATQLLRSSTSALRETLP